MYPKKYQLTERMKAFPLKGGFIKRSLLLQCDDNFMRLFYCLRLGQKDSDDNGENTVSMRFDEMLEYYVLLSEAFSLDMNPDDPST